MKRMTPVLCTILVHFPFTKSYAQLPAASVAMPYAGATAYSKGRADAFAFTANPAALAGVHSMTTGIYAEKRFLLEEARFYRAALAFAAKRDHFGICLDRSGVPAFGKSCLGIGYGRSLGKLLDVGILFEYNSFRVREYGSASAVTGEAGMLWHFNEKVHGGLSVYNPMRVKWPGTGERLPAVYKAGVGYEPSSLLFVHAELIKEAGRPVDVLAGIQYSASHHVRLCTGIQSALSVFYAGGGIAWRHFRADLSVSHHPQLGFSPGILLLFSK